MTATYKMRASMVSAVLAGLALRAFFVLKFPATNSGDAPFYIALAWNWLKNGVFGFPVNGRLVPLDMRTPGYPAFLAAVFAFAGQSNRAVMLSQVVVDTATCLLVAAIAARLAPSSSRRRVALAGLWLAALCPFTANYSAVVLSETLAVFLTALATLVLLETPLGRFSAQEVLPMAAERPFSPWLLAGVVCGFGALVRPETPLLLLAAGLVLVGTWWRPAAWPKLLRAGALLAVGLVLPLIPWAARNYRTLHEVQFLAPRYSELPGEFAPLGFNAWTNTWLWRFRDVYLVPWKLDEEPIELGDIPAGAFDTPGERARIANLLARYNTTLTLTPEMDRAFGEIARARTSRHPWRTHLEIPLLRSFALWFTPRIDLLPFSGRLWPPGAAWDDDRVDFSVTLMLALAGAAYVALGFAGAWRARGQPGLALLVAFIVVRTAFFAFFVETPEPRYVLECFPALLALAAQLWRGPRQPSPAGSG